MTLPFSAEAANMDVKQEQRSGSERRQNLFNTVARTPDRRRNGERRKAEMADKMYIESSQWLLD